MVTHLVNLGLTVKKKEKDKISEWWIRCSRRKRRENGREHSFVLGKRGKGGRFFGGFNPARKKERREGEKGERRDKSFLRGVKGRKKK